MNGPTRYVVDASVGVKWILPEPGSDRACALLAEVAAGHAHLLAPDLYAAEVANVLWQRASLRAELTEEEAREALRALLVSLPELVPSEALLPQALALALAFRRPVYDCLYAALAVREGCTLVTADRRLAGVLGPATARVTLLEELAAGA